jgi:hypothetical protein
VVDIYPVLILLLGCIPLVIIRLLHIQQYRQDISEGKVSSVEGRVRKIEAGGFSLRVGEMPFRIERSLLPKIINHRNYRVYYTPHSKVIMSIELLDDKP